MPEVKKVKNFFAKPKDRTVSIGIFLKFNTRKKGSNMQEISLTKKSIHWFMYKMDVK